MLNLKIYLSSKLHNFVLHLPRYLIIFFQFRSLSLSDIIPESKLRARPPSVSETVETTSSCAGSKRTQHLSETSDGGSTDSSGCDYFSDECDVLQEMFPESSFLEVGFDALFLRTKKKHFTMHCVFV